MSDLPTPKALLSYAWKSPDYNERVKQLADRLIDDSVDLLFDRYDLNEDADKFLYMERAVTKEVSKVIVLCDPVYKQKADAREGGVGTKSTIISSEVYQQSEGKTKYVAIIFEASEDERSVLPTMFESKIYIGLLE